MLSVTFKSNDKQQCSAWTLAPLTVRVDIQDVIAGTFHSLELTSEETATYISKLTNIRKAQKVN